MSKNENAELMLKIRTTAVCDRRSEYAYLRCRTQRPSDLWGLAVAFGTYPCLIYRPRQG